MYLIDVQDLEHLTIRHFEGDPPPYAILSHKWGKEEVTYHESHKLVGSQNAAALKKSFEKIKKCCKQTAADGLRYVWVDTCCIDKRSSAELSEAINSMFNYYRDAVICYAFLEDVISSEKPTSPESQFGKSTWFARGWTLQELLAPSIVVFFNSTWENIGTREELRPVISAVTHISPSFFTDGDMEKFSVAQKMSWASRRQCTRVEDEAYCLLGIFGVNMPLLYGEGIRAFIRLQEEVMKVSDDQSLFAWAPPKPQSLSEYDFSNTDSTKLNGGLLAPSAAHFQASGNIIRASSSRSSLEPPWAMTNKGLRISLPLVDANSVPSVQTLNTYPHRTLAILDCRYEDDETSKLAVFLGGPERLQDIEPRSHLPIGPFVRTDYRRGLIKVNENSVGTPAKQRELLIRPKESSSSNRPWPNYRDGRLVLIEALPPAVRGFKLTETIPQIQWKSQKDTGVTSFRLSKSNFSYGRVALMFKHLEGYAFLLIIKPQSHYDSFPRFDVQCAMNVNRAEQRKDWKDRFYNKMTLGSGVFQDTPLTPETPDGRYHLRLKVRQLQHALMINLNNVGDGTRGSPNDRRLLSPGSPRALMMPPPILRDG
ncbi:hypothetical protein JX265_006467 [Neoarthrinium moseri]|uniref:Heterokaryon incompatibility domain-containing protein n=1 Tax=Neoarthrinium moseri TaxID=1658444 RepID=A0A9Q0ANX2_9PEZI|nr:hypothetical protein JX265_006467 [Neoarthrinium moseri]